MKCPSCKQEIPETAVSCPSCHLSFGDETQRFAPGEAEGTRLFNEEDGTKLLKDRAAPAHRSSSPSHGSPAPGSSSPSRSSPSISSGSTSPSYDSIDNARFVPGMILAGRYRIVGLLGKGGMGEVYRADDLKLSQPVALKFLPDHLTTDGAALARFHREVRIARQNLAPQCLSRLRHR
jgi:hypothetical protein